MIVDKWYRHLSKAITWRIVAFIALAVLSFIVTGSLTFAASIALVDSIVKFLLYIVHEWGWSKTSFGRKMSKQKGCVIWLTGLSGSGKTTIADAVADKLRSKLIPVKRLDGDVARRTFSCDLGFSKEDRDENNKRAAHVASYLSEEHVVLASFISPYQEQRDYARAMCGEFREIFVRTPIHICEERDPKGLYKKARAGEIKSFTGIHIDAPYQFPVEPNLIIDTDKSIGECVDELISYMKDSKLI